MKTAEEPRRDFFENPPTNTFDRDIQRYVEFLASGQVNPVPLLREMPRELLELILHIAEEQGLAPILRAACIVANAHHERTFIEQPPFPFNPQDIGDFVRCVVAGRQLQHTGYESDERMDLQRFPDATLMAAQGAEQAWRQEYLRLWLKHETMVFRVQRFFAWFRDADMDAFDEDQLLRRAPDDITDAYRRMQAVGAEIRAILKARNADEWHVEDHG